MTPSRERHPLDRNFRSKDPPSETTVQSTALVRKPVGSAAEERGDQCFSSMPTRTRYIFVRWLLRAFKARRIADNVIIYSKSIHLLTNLLVSAIRALAGPACPAPGELLPRLRDAIMSFASFEATAEPSREALCLPNGTKSPQGGVTSIDVPSCSCQDARRTHATFFFSRCGIVCGDGNAQLLSARLAMPGHCALRFKRVLLAIILRAGGVSSFGSVPGFGHWWRDTGYSRSRVSSPQSSASQMAWSLDRQSTVESFRSLCAAASSVSRAQVVFITSVASIFAILAANALAAEATMRIMAHPRIVRIVVEGEHVSARHFEHKGSVARLSFAEPVRLSVPSVPAAARPWLAVAELREEGRVLALALGPQVRAQLGPAQAGRVVIDLEMDEAGREPSSRPGGGAGQTNTASLRVRLGRHREHWRIVLEGEASATLVARPGAARLDLFGPPTLLAELAQRVSGLGDPILGTTLDQQSLTVRLSPGVMARLRQAKPNEVVVDLVPSGRMLARPPVVSTNSGERVSSGSDRTGRPPAAVSTAVGQTSDEAEPRGLGARPDRAPDAVGAPCRADAGERFLCIRGRIGAEEADLWLIAEPRPRIAAFTRGGSVWIVLDRVLDETDFDLAGVGSNNAISDLKYHSLSNATVLELQHKRPFFPDVSADAKGWRLSLRPDSALRAVEEAQVARLADPPSLSIATPGKPTILPSRLVGSDLVVITTDAAAALPEPRRLVDLEFLASGRGVVWRPAADDLEMRSSSEQLVVSREGGLNLDFRDHRAMHAAVGSTGAEKTSSNLATTPNNDRPDVVPRAHLEQGEGAVRPEIVSRDRKSNRAQLSVGSIDRGSVASVNGKAHGTDAQKELGLALSPARQLEVPSSAPADTIARTDGAHTWSRSAEAMMGTPPGGTTATPSLVSETPSGRSGRETTDSAGAPATLPPRRLLSNSPGAGDDRLQSAVAESGAPAFPALKERPLAKPSGEPVIGAQQARGFGTSEEAMRARGGKPPAHQASTSPIGLARRKVEPEPLLAQRRAELLERRARADADERVALGIELARIELGRGRAAEGLVFLDVSTSVFDPDTEPPSDVAVRALTGVAGILLGRAEPAERLLADQRLDGDPEAALWRGVAAASRQEWARAARALTESGRSLQALPPALQRRLAPIVGRVLVEDGRASTALALIERVRRLDPEPHEIQKLVLVEGLARAREGATAEALAALKEAGAGPDRTTAIEANYRSALLQYTSGRKNAEQVLQDLERQRLAWRGHPMEAEMLDGLTQLQLATGKLVDAMSTARDRRARRPDRPASEMVALQLAESLQAAINRAVEGVGDPLAALRALRTEPDLLPTGERGAALARALADRLARDGLPASAASVLEDHGLPRVEGAARAELLLDIAELRLRAGEPAEARATLERLEAGAMRAAAVRARAEGLHAALQTSSATSSESASLRTSPAQILEAAWQARDWPTVIHAGERLLADGPPSMTATWTDTDKRTVLLRMALAYAAQGDRETARALLAKYAALLGGTPEAMLAALITEMRVPTGNATAVARDLDSELADLRAGLSLAR